jgi:TonB dependent receptor
VTGIAAKYLSGIEDWTAKIDYDYVPNTRHYVKFGGSATHHTFRPGAFNVKTQGSTTAIDTTFGENNKFAGEFALYGEDDWQISKSFKLNAGLHVSGFAVDGKFYPSVQPRLSARYLLPSNVALKGSFTTMTQFIHLLVNEGIGLPTDLWVPTTGRILPQQAWQGAIGAAKTVFKDFELSAELYYKNMDNLVSYSEGTSFLGVNNTWEDKVTQGKGRAYGLELMLQKKAGKTTGWLGYTLSRSERQFAAINFGKPYPFKYDRTHDFEAVVIHKFSNRFQMSASWQYSTGATVTLPLLTYNGLIGVDDFSGFSSNQITYYGEKNSYRMPDFHRLDVSMEWHKKKKKWERTWVLGVYNVYNRQNPFFIFQGINETTGDQEFKQISILPILPSLSYEFKF